MREFPVLGFRHDDCDNARLIDVEVEVEARTSPKVHANATASSILLYILLLFIMLSTSCKARPHNITSTNGSPTVQHQNASRTRILTFPQRPTASNSHVEREDVVDYPSDIVFPDSLESYASGGSGHVAFEPVARIEVTPACAASGDTFCEDIPAYPYKLLRDVLSRSKSVAADSVLFGADETPDEIAQRIGEPEENYICGAVDKTVFPKAGKNKNNKWKYIINQGSKDGYVQGVRVELCIATGKPCDLFGSQPNGYVTACKQKFIYRKMMSLSEGGQPIPDTFLMPSACCCSYKRDNRFLARFGEAPITPAH